jgi:AmmeMemoRadiSam system protein B
MKKGFLLLFIISLLLFTIVCKRDTRTSERPSKIRNLADTVGYAHTAEQMDSLIKLINNLYGPERKSIYRIHNIQENSTWKTVICPHDDYSYVGELYPYVIENLSAKTVFIFGVAHQAQTFDVENNLIFDSFSHWKGPYGNIQVSPVRQELMELLPINSYIVHDSLHQIEHSVEALLPFLQYYHPSTEIVAILVPAMNFDKMKDLSNKLAQVIKKVVVNHQWQWGIDFAFAISNDCVHYGDQSWKGKNFAPFNADSAGYRSATNFDMNIISECLIDQLDPQRIKRFFEYTVDKNNYKKYAWTWCGRYAVPFGLLTSYYLQRSIPSKGLYGKMLRYTTSITYSPLPLENIGLGKTAPANIRHWVGYVSIGYDFQ